ncbi:hypothetical protein F3Y22_tig00111402pilonHSYRG00081 [Hibiscus syriacus]|uniref:RNase H type-1 domain-containing protein n=1 Tax=Hibiscus syriacus TaxID=106335 RepID=A0A6A2XT52_HIBSY|nr:hypothetical protein F3Y22_tig00111402pilonHSYRG00081 [Hibiscus syriacus]
MAIKVDLEKAYDRVGWDFLADSLAEINCPTKIHRIIMQSISSSSMQILWNDSLSEESSPSRINQGFPLSSYLAMCIDNMEAAGGGVIRDSSGDWIAGYTRNIGRCTACHAELWAVLDSLEFAWKYGIRQLVVELVNLEAVRQLNSPTLESNRLADALAQLGRKMEVGLLSFKQPPQEIHKLLDSDKAALRTSNIGVVEKFFRYKILALVGGAPTRVMIWDDHQNRCIRELSFRSEVLHQIEIIAKSKGFCAASQGSGSLVLVCPGLHKGQVRVEHLLLELIYVNMFEPNSATLVSVLSACAHLKDLQVGKVIHGTSTLMLYLLFCERKRLAFKHPGYVSPTPVRAA